MREGRHSPLKVSKAWWIHWGGSGPCVLHINNISIAPSGRCIMMHYTLARLKESQPVTDKVSDVAQEIPAVAMTSQAHLRPIKKTQPIFSCAKIHIHTNNATLDSLVSLTNATQSVLSSLWLCPQHLFTKPSEANRLAYTMVRASIKTKYRPCHPPIKKETWKRNRICRTERRKRRGGGENDETEIKDSFAAQKIWVFPFPDPQLLFLSGVPWCRSQIAWLNSRVELTLSDIYIPIEVFLFLKF